MRDRDVILVTGAAGKVLAALALLTAMPGAPASILGSHALIEHLTEASGLEWTILRPTGFAANTLG